MNICVFCGASPNSSEEHLAVARATGAYLAKVGATVIFGGGSRGMMGAVATSAVENGASVIGILPRFLFEREPPHPLVADLRIVADMHERKAAMYALADAFLTLPGGFGTLDETLEVLTWRQLSIHDKPVVFVGSEAFWGGLHRTFDEMHRNGFLSDADRRLAAFAPDAPGAWAALNAMTS